VQHVEYKELADSFGIFGRDQLGDCFRPSHHIVAGGGSPEQLVTAPTTLASGWHHVAVTIEADINTVNLYLDGVVVASNVAVTLTPSDLGDTTNNWLGRSQYSADAYFDGCLDDFRIYDYASLSSCALTRRWVTQTATASSTLRTLRYSFLTG